MIPREDWIKFEEEQKKAVLEEMNPHLSPTEFAPEKTSLRILPLSFYDEYDLYELTDFENIPNVRKYVLYKPGHVYPINWSNDPIYKLNAAAPIALNQNNLADYIKFFFEFVRGRHGRFIVVETVDEISWKEDPPLQARKALQEMIKPVIIKDIDESGKRTCLVSMIFKDSLFRSVVTVDANGMVQLSDEELLVEGMPIIQDGQI